MVAGQAYVRGMASGPLPMPRKRAFCRLGADSEEPAPAFRSLGADAYEVRKNVHSTLTMPGKDHPGLSRVDLEFLHGFEEKDALVKAARDLMAARDSMGSAPPPPCAPASGAKRKRA